MASSLLKEEFWTEDLREQESLLSKHSSDSSATSDLIYKNINAFLPYFPYNYNGL